ncbi:MAG: EamA family transporter [Verrucomicrobia bacterium]|nr:EamA family transporter [Verrucomicrobiota bacterium]
MTKVLIVLLIGLAAEAAGVVLLKRGIDTIGQPKQISVSEIAGVVRRGAANANILLGVAFEAAFFATLLYLLAQRNVSLIWPLTSLSFVFTAIAAKLLLDERVSSLRWIGIVLIVLGAGLVSYSEKENEASARQAPATSEPVAR